MARPSGETVTPSGCAPTLTERTIREALMSTTVNAEASSLET